MDVYQKKQEHLQAGDPNDLGDAWVWRAIALPCRLRVVHHLSHQRSEQEAGVFLAKFKARTDGRPPLFTSDKLSAYVDALIANYSTAEPPPVNRGPGRPRQHSRRVLDPELCYAQVDKRREQGRVVEVRRRIIFGTPEIITEILGSQQINTSQRSQVATADPSNGGRADGSHLDFGGITVIPCAPGRGHMTFPGLEDQHLLDHIEDRQEKNTTNSSSAGRSIQIYGRLRGYGRVKPSFASMPSFPRRMGGSAIGVSTCGEVSSVWFMTLHHRRTVRCVAPF
jgi:hypothetical protein